MAKNEIDHLNELAWESRRKDLKASYESSLSLLEWSESLEYAEGIAASCRTLGYCFWRFSDFTLSLNHSLRAIDIYREIGDRKGEADTLNNIGAVYMFQNDHARRLEVNQQCMEIREEIGDLEGAISSENNIGETYFEMDDYENAEKCFYRVLEADHAPKTAKAWSFHNLGKVCQVRKQWDKALDYFLNGLRLSEEANYQVLITESYLAIVDHFMRQQLYDKALDQALKALEVSGKINARDGERMALYYLAEIYEALGKFEEALSYHKKFHQLDVETNRSTEIERLKSTQLQVAFDKIEIQKNELMDSIRYAERIQMAVLTRDQKQKLLKDYFILFKPRDIVSGDFYWYSEQPNHFYIAVADCTGHGVPGAFLTMLGTTYMNEIISINPQISPAALVEELRLRISEALMNREDEKTWDGLDISVAKVHPDTLKAEWCGANNPIWIVRKKHTTDTPDRSVLTNGKFNLIEIKGDTQAVAFAENMEPFTNHELQLHSDDRIYLFSDGFKDQFGGPNNYRGGKKFMKKHFKELLLSISHETLDRQKELLDQAFNDWKGANRQIDDVCVLGFRITD